MLTAIGAGATVDAKNDVAVVAQAQEHMVILAAGLAASGAVGLGGGVTVRSAVDRGSTFIVELPRPTARTEGT